MRSSLSDRLTDQRTWSMVASYARSMLAASLAVMLTGNYSLEDMAKAAVAAILPVIIRWLNPNDPAYGRQRTP
jgi:hypothetical protein